MKNIAILLLASAFLAACSDGPEDGGDMQVSNYEVPELSDNPPMSGSDIDAITREIEAREGKGGGA